MGGKAGDALPALQQRVDRAERVADNLLDSLEPFANALLGELENGGFGFVQDFVGGIGLLAGFGDGGIGDVDQPAQDGLVADDSDVMLDGWPVGYAVKQAGM